MNIDPNLLKTRGAICKHYDKNEIIFFEDEEANYFFQLIHGTVKLFNVNNEGRQFLQGLFSDGESFGEPPLFINQHYPCSAVTLQESTVLRIHKEEFLELFSKHPSMQVEMIELLSQRLYDKAVNSKEIVNHTPESRILSFLTGYKRKCQFSGKLEIPFTRQTIADFTGLRVETVIRTLNRMKREQKVEIINRRIVY